MKRETSADWLLRHVNYVGDDCLIWPFGKIDKGYGQLKYDGKIRKAHRVMCFLAHGEPPSDVHEAAHECGNGTGGCVNPAHLKWKTRSENQLDRRRHGTAVTSTVGHRGKISRAERAAIRSAAKTMSRHEIAAIYGVHYETICRILRQPDRPRKFHEALTPDQVRMIRRIGYTKSGREIAELMGLKNRDVVQRIRLGRTYQDVV